MDMIRPSAEIFGYELKEDNKVQFIYKALVLENKRGNSGSP